MSSGARQPTDLAYGVVKPLCLVPRLVVVQCCSVTTDSGVKLLSAWSECNPQWKKALCVCVCVCVRARACVCACTIKSSSSLYDHIPVFMSPRAHLHVVRMLMSDINATPSVYLGSKQQLTSLFIRAVQLYKLSSLPSYQT